MRWRGALVVAASVLSAAGSASGSSEPVWTDASRRHALWISGEALNAALDPATLERRTGAPLPLDATEAAELKWQLTHFRDFQPGGLVSQADFAAGVCYSAPEDAVGPLHGEPRRSLADLMLAKGSGFAAVTEVESAEVGWSPESKRVTTLFTVRTVRTIWSSASVKEVPASFRVLMQGGFITIAGINICRAPSEESDGLRRSDLLFVWGDLDPNNPSVMTQGHKLRIVNNMMDSQYAFCIREPELTLDQLEQQLQAGKKRP